MNSRKLLDLGNWLNPPAEAAVRVGCQGDPVRRRTTERTSREFFNPSLHRDQLCTYYLATVLAPSGAS